MQIADLSSFITFSVALFAILNPFGNAAFILGMVSPYAVKKQNKIAMNCSIAVGIILLVTIWVGLEMLRFFGISVGALTLAGGIIVFLIGLNMLQGSGHSKRSKDGHHIGVVPLAIPIIAGPGAMSTILSHTELLNNIDNRIFASLICILLTFVIWLILRFSPVLVRVIGSDGMSIIARIMGLILAAIAVQMAYSGIVDLFPLILK